MLSIVDLVLILIIAAFAFFGLFFGFIHTLGSLLGTVLGVFLASRLIDPVYEAYGWLLGGGAVGKVIMFVILFVLISRLVGLMFWFLEKTFNLLKIIPFAKTINRLLGAVLGFLEGVLVVAVVVYIALQFIHAGALEQTLRSSPVVIHLLYIVDVIKFLFPQQLKQLKEILPNNLIPS